MDIDGLLAQLIEAGDVYRKAIAAAQAHGGPIVKQARRDLGLTQRELAERLGVDFTYISKIENGHTVAGKPFLRSLVELMRQQSDTPPAGIGYQVSAIGYGEAAPAAPRVGDEGKEGR